MEEKSLLSWAKDEVVLANMRQKYDDARRAGKEGAGTHRNCGDAGNIAAEWMRWRQEALRRGLIGQGDM